MSLALGFVLTEQEFSSDIVLFFFFYVFGKKTLVYTKQPYRNEKNTVVLNNYVLKKPSGSKETYKLMIYKVFFASPLCHVVTGVSTGITKAADGGVFITVRDLTAAGILPPGSARPDVC